MSLPRMSWHIGDYKKDTGHLRAAGHGAYFLLCMHYWATGGLPDDDKQLATIACMTDREWRAHRDIIKALFKGEGGPWKHKRIEEELANAQAKYDKRSAAGKKGGNAKANGKQKPSNATAKSYQPITDNLSSEAKASGEAPSENPKAEFFRRGREIFGPSSGGLLSKVLRSQGDEDDVRTIAKARAAIETASTKANPAEWVGRIISPKRNDFKEMSGIEGVI